MIEFDYMVVIDEEFYPSIMYFSTEEEALAEYKTLKEQGFYADGIISVAKIIK
jgi:hypothetical protein